MALKNSSMYAILGILSLSDSTGYDIKKYCDRVLSGFWNENFGHIYPTLKRMLEEQTIQIIETGDRKAIIRYGITTKGRRELEAWLGEEPEQRPARSELMLKLLFSSDRPRESVVMMLTRQRIGYETQLLKLQQTQRELQTGLPDVADRRAVFMNAILRKGILSIEASIRWCDETIDTLQHI